MPHCLCNILYIKCCKNGCLISSSPFLLVSFHVLYLLLFHCFLRHLLSVLLHFACVMSCTGTTGATVTVSTDLFTSCIGLSSDCLCPGIDSTISAAKFQYLTSLLHGSYCPLYSFTSYLFFSQLHRTVSMKYSTFIANVNSCSIFFF